MKLHSIAALVCSLILAGCASGPVKIDATKEARIRVGLQGKIDFHPNKTCYATDQMDAVNVALGGFSMIGPKLRIGMPKSEDMPRSYHEYVIQAGQPLTIEMVYAQPHAHTTYQAGTYNVSKCGPIGATFTPQPGRDYDTFLRIENGMCSIALRELAPVQGGPSKPTPVKSAPAGPC